MDNLLQENLNIAEAWKLVSPEVAEVINNLQARRVNNAFTAIKLMGQGYVPVECAFGNVSIVDDNILDHHGSYSDLEPISIRAFKYLHGTKAEDPRFVFTGDADADATFAVAAMLGAIPYDERNFILASLVAKLDLDPVGVDLQSEPAGAYITVWNYLLEYDAGQDSFKRAVFYWAFLANLSPDYVQGIADKITASTDVSKINVEKVGKVGIVAGVPFQMMSQLYRNIANNGLEQTPEGWENPVIVFHDQATASDEVDTIVIGCANKAVAEGLFGEGGLKNVFSKLGEGWGGRESIGGSPRGRPMRAEELMAIAEVVNALILK